MILTDLAYEVGLNPKKVSNTLCGEYHSECPACGGKDRFIMNPNKPTKNGVGTYWCRKCGIYGDSIQFCRNFLGLSFKEAIDRTNSNIIMKPSACKVFRENHKFTPAELKNPPSLWQENAEKFVNASHQEIFNQQDVLEWLMKRGIGDAVIKNHKLGWNRCDYSVSRESWGLEPRVDENGKPVSLFFSEGLVIPSTDASSGYVNRIKIRRKKWLPNDKLPRYLAISGSMNGLTIFGNRSSKIMVCVESEIDAIFLDSVIGDKACIIAVGGNVKNPDNLTDLLVKQASLILICHDNDEAGLNMLKKWQSLYPHATAFPTPVGKDIGEALEQAFDVNQWIVEKLSSKKKGAPDM